MNGPLRSKRLRFSVLALVVLVTAVGCGANRQVSSATATPTSALLTAAPALEGTITVSGAFALYPMMQVWREEFTRLYPDVRFDISAGGAGKGMTDALSGAVDIGMVSRSISPEEEGRGAFWVPVVTDSVFPTINADNPVVGDLMKQGIGRDTLIKIYITGEITTWGQVVNRPDVNDAIHVYTRSDACGAADVWAKFLGDRKQEDLLGIAVSGDPAVIGAVVGDPLGIGFDNINYAFDTATGLPIAHAQVAPIDANNNGVADPDELFTSRDAAVEAVATGKYPSPPARDDNLVTRGKPTGLVMTFIDWILTDGQKYVSEAGYIPLTEEKLDAARAKLGQ